MKIAIFASGGGSNARKILEHFSANDLADVKLIVSNKKNAGVLNHAAEYGVSTHILQRKCFYESRDTMTLLDLYDIDLIVLAGFLWLMPDYIVKGYNDRIINIHPSLLPKYGGKGMYGKHVHKAVYAAGESESGMTIHLVNEEYDKGRVLFQGKTDISQCQSADDIAAAVLRLEHNHYPQIIESYIVSCQTS